MATETETNAAEFSVSEIAFAVKRMVEDSFGYVRVRGEVSGFRGQVASGHCYFALKDDKARLDAVIWRGTYARLKVKPEEGLEVIVTGRLTTFPGSSKYQIVVDRLEPAGVGALMALLEERRTRLAAEGLFDAARKKELPRLPRTIGVVTSPTGAVIRDIVHRLSDRFPVRVLIWPVRVQGESSAAEVAAAITGFNAMSADGRVPRPDLLIVARGGGSIEDLWGFNEEVVARAAAASDIPLISAIGHETDWTLIDFVADLRAPTPTGAAEMAVPVRADLLATVADLGVRQANAASRVLDQRRSGFRACARALPSLRDLLALPRQRLDTAAARLSRALLTGTAVHAARLAAAAARTGEGALVRTIGRCRESASSMAARLVRAGEADLRRRRHDLTGRAGRLDYRLLDRRLSDGRRNLRHLNERAEKAVDRYLADHARAVAAAAKLTDSLSPARVLGRGFAIVRDAKGAIIRSAGTVAAGDRMAVQLADGVIDAAALTGAARPAKRGRSADPKSTAPGQGSLF